MKRRVAETSVTELNRLEQSQRWNVRIQDLEGRLNAGVLGLEVMIESVSTSRCCKIRRCRHNGGSDSLQRCVRRATEQFPETPSPL